MARSRFSPEKKAEIVIESLNTKIGTAEICRKHNVHPRTFSRWRRRFIAAGLEAVAGDSTHTIHALERKKKFLQNRLNELIIANNALRNASEKKAE